MQAWYSHKNNNSNKAVFWGIKTNGKKSQKEDPFEVCLAAERGEQSKKLKKLS